MFWCKRDIEEAYYLLAENLLGKSPVGEEYRKNAAECDIVYLKILWLEQK